MDENAIEKYGKRFFPFIIGIPLFLIMIFLLIHFTSDESNYNTMLFNEQSQEISNVIEYEIQALELIDQYFESRTLASRQYDGVLVQVIGDIREVGRDTEDNFYILLYGHFSWDGLRCIFEDEEFSTRIPRGEEIKLVGRVRGLARNIVVLDECRII